MLNVDQAFRLVIKNAQPSKIISCSLIASLGKILREDIHADRPYPSFNKSLMDGIGISFKEWLKGTRSFHVEKVIPPGCPQYHLKDLRQCVHIMTGAVIPKGVDCVVPIEHVLLKDNIAQLDDAICTRLQCIRHKGSDIKAGEVVLRQGEQLNPAHLGVIASVGKKTIHVTDHIKAAVVSTGDELVDIGFPIKSFQSRISNAYALKAVLESTSLAKVDMFHYGDDPRLLRSSIAKLIKKYDVIILSGGVSMGAFDHIPKVLEALHVRKIFHGVHQKPGKPFWYGISKEGKAIFALPGNPASTLVCAYRYIIPFLYKSAGGKYQQRSITLGEELKLSGTGTIFIPVKNDTIIKHGGSGDITAWAQADGFIEYDTRSKENIRSYFSWRI